MNELFIVTQGISILNLSKVQSIGLLGGVLENEDTAEAMEVIEIAAVMEFGDEDEPIPLGYYITEEKALSVMEELIAWLSEKNEYKRVFRMPDIDIPEEDSENSGTKLDYSMPDE